ncbi:MAG: hypothetical protein BHW56_07050 [Acetobacter sp. 46_36]|mgnify:FL=1|nr:MAG: hypothetical protein BHW56_07050 [Acetobacter sp. 46_36]
MVFEKITLYLERNTLFSFCSCIIKKVDHKAGLYFLAGILTVLSLFFIKSIYSYSYVYHGSDLRMKSGYVLVEKGVKTQNAKKGIFTYGPYVKLAAGEYKITLNYELSKNAGASFDIVTDKGKKLLYKGNLLPSQKQINHKIKLDKSCEIEVRTFYSGKGDLMVKQLTIVPLSVFAKYDVLLLITLFTLFFLLYFKILAWLMKLKWVQNKSRIDIVFLTVFFILLFLPMLHISDAEKSEQENRMLAKYTPLIDYRGGYNLKYGKNFDAWFSDRFWGRDELIKVYYKIKKINKYTITAKASKLKNDWYFNDNELSTLTISEKQKVQYKKNIQYLLQFCKENNIKCYMEIVPAKIYYAKDGLINNKLKEYNDTLPQFIKYIKETLNFEIIYPLDELKEADKSDYVYFKTDHHWTDWGAYIGYQALLKQLKKDFPDIYEAKEGDFDISYSKKVRAEADRKYWQGYTCNLLYQNQDCSLNIDYKYYDGKNKHINAISYGEFHNSDGKYKALLIGNSFTENFKPFLVYSFKDIKRFRCNIAPNDNLKLSRWKKEILEFKPDVLILLFQEGYTDKLRTIKD